MKTTHSFFKFFIAASFFMQSFCLLQSQEHVKMRLFDEVLFYNGYRVKDNPDKDKFKEDGVLRNYTYLYAVKMTPEQLNQFGDSVVMNVWIKACCDNYDRIGNINLALIDKDSTEYDPYYNEDMRMELGRFITPFMNKNRQPDTVPYTYRVDYLSHLFRDKALREKYNFWIEFELFGIPYAANEQIEGCAGRNDVFFGTLEFDLTTPPLPETDKNVLVPIVIKKPEYKGHNLNNYKQAATDTLGKTVKTYTFEVPQDVEDGQLVLVTSNHGANAGGEEYNRRWHYIYMDDELVLTYKPGRNNCEPFRKYNTQSNGIYGMFRKSDEAWQSFSNWCPGDAIDNRIINLDRVNKGMHKVRISVPEAVFADAKGDIPVSMFFQGLTEGKLPSDVEEGQKISKTSIQVEGTLLIPKSDEAILSIELYNVQGNRLYYAENDHPISLSDYPQGLYLVNIELASGIIVTHKVWK